MRRYLLFLPSFLTGLIGGVWLLMRPLQLEANAGPLGVLLSAALLVALLLGGAWLLERLLPSFRFASKLLERALLGLPITLPLAVGLAALTAASEELLFRGALLALVGVWGQALLFALLHPAPKRAWSYTAYTFIAGAAFGYATLLTGSLWAAMLAHFVINLQGFLEVRRLQRKRARRLAYPRPPPHAPPRSPQPPPGDPNTQTATLNPETPESV